MTKLPEWLSNVKRWTVGVDPGFGTSALVLAADGTPIAAAAARDRSRKSLAQRTHTMGMWYKMTIQQWIDKYDIETLHVIIELAFLNDKTRNVTTLATQMRMHGVYVERLYSLEFCEVWLGEVTNKTAKKCFTGHGNASKDIMINYSMWAKRHDIGEDREHLADAQAMGECYPEMMYIDPHTLPKEAYHVDGNVGAGPKWEGKLPARRTR